MFLGHDTILSFYFYVTLLILPNDNTKRTIAFNLSMIFFSEKKDRSSKPQSHIHGFGPGRATVHPDLSNRGASA